MRAAGRAIYVAPRSLPLSAATAADADMNSLIICLVVVGAATSYAQMRSPYAPNPVGVVKVLPRFQGEEDNTANRFGEEETARPLPSTPSSLAGANVDPELASRVAEWPQEQQPFWFQNAQAIRNHQQKSVNELPPPPPRSPFAANIRN